MKDCDCHGKPGVHLLTLTSWTNQQDVKIKGLSNCSRTMHGSWNPHVAGRLEIAPCYVMGNIYVVYFRNGFGSYCIASLITLGKLGVALTLRDASGQRWIKGMDSGTAVSWLMLGDLLLTVNPSIIVEPVYTGLHRETATDHCHELVADFSSCIESVRYLNARVVIPDWVLTD